MPNNEDISSEVIKDFISANFPKNEKQPAPKKAELPSIGLVEAQTKYQEKSDTISQADSMIQTYVNECSQDFESSFLKE